VGGPEGSKQRRIRALQGVIRDEMGLLERQSREWLQKQVPAVYHAGAVAAAEVTGSNAAEFLQVHREALQALADQNWKEILDATRFVSADTKRAVRKLAENQTARALLGEVTASKAGRDLAAAIREETGALSVRYANGARHGLADYSDTLARTVTANAYNAGELNQSKADGVKFMECFDGAACQLETHNSGGFANGLVLPIEEAYKYPLAHPRCARSWGPRPDITNRTEARLAQRFTAAEQEAMAAAENARAAVANVNTTKGFFSREREAKRAARRAREPRTPRTPRVSRQPVVPNPLEGIQVGEVIRFAPVGGKNRVSIVFDGTSRTPSLTMVHGVRVNAQGAVDSQARRHAFAIEPGTRIERLPSS
jgi:hypothetical protein